MFITKLAATLVVIAASTIAPSIATAAPPHAPENPTSVIESVGVKYTMFLPVFSGDAYDNEMGVRIAYWLPEVGDDVP